MPDIGQTLREARMRQRVDITHVEQETKIRAKYLRALENEEWELLPGPAYTRSFLRAYAEALGLDGRELVEEYKFRHERVAEADLPPIRPGGRAVRDPRRPPRRPLPRGAVVGAVVVALLALLWVLGQGADEEPQEANRVAPPPTSTAAPRGETAERAQRGSSTTSTTRRSRRVSLQLVPSGPVWVCLQAGDRRLISGRQLEAGSPTRTFRARRFRLTLGNGNVVLRINGRARQVPESSEPIGYVITRQGRRTLAEGERPTCA